MEKLNFASDIIDSSSLSSVNTSSTRDNNSSIKTNENQQHAILSLDIGTTNLKCSLYDSNLNILYSNSSQLNVLQPRKNFSELDPKNLYELIKYNINDCILKCPEDHVIKCFGISTQRNSITLWNKINKKTYSNFILWNDKRTTEICNDSNKSLFIYGIRKFSQIYSSIISNHRFNAISKYKMETTHITPRLIAQLRSLENRLETKELENILYGTIDTWFIHSFTKENKYATDITCACSTGIYDMFLDEWSKILCYLFSIPEKILPCVYDSCYHYGTIKPNLFDLKNEVPLTASIGDVQSSFIAECAFSKGDIVITTGTGAFISANVGNKPVSSNNNNYPLIGYRYKKEKAYILHCPVSSPGVAIEWAKLIESSNGVTFFPGFGLFTLSDLQKNEHQTDYYKYESASFYGIKLTTTKSDLLRAIFDSIAYSIKIKFDSIRKDLIDLNININSIKIAGGVARSNFLCQLLSNLFNHSIERNSDCHTSSSIGAAFLAGLSSGMWNNLNDLNQYRKHLKIFQPIFTKNKKFTDYQEDLENWKKCVLNSI